MDKYTGRKPVVLFDGWCGLCCSFAGWLIRRDREHILMLAPLQGETARKLLGERGYESPPADTIILISGGTMYLRSAAVLRILKIIGTPWSWLYPLINLPRPMRDMFYDLVAAARYRVSGRRSSCRVAGSGEEGRMLP